MMFGSDMGSSVSLQFSAQISKTNFVVIGQKYFDLKKNFEILGQIKASKRQKDAAKLLMESNVPE